MESIKAKSLMWRSAVATELGIENAEDYSSFELMCNLFENGDSFDERIFKYIKYEYDLDITISDDEYRHELDGIVLKVFKLCKEVYKQIPARMEQEFKYFNQDKCWSKYLGYLAEHNEKAVVNVFRSMNASIVEVKVQTSELDAEILYWNKGQVFIMNFVPELDEDSDETLSIKEL